MKSKPPRSLFRSRVRTGTTESFFRPRAVGPVSVGRSDPAASRRPSDRDADRIATAIRKTNGCGLCPVPATRAATWFPTPEASKRLGAPADKMRVVVVGLCAACRSLPDVMQRIEDTMFAEAAVELRRPEAN